MPGITRRQMTLYMGGGAIAVVLILVIVFAVIGANNAQRAEQERAATAVVQAQTETVNLANTQAAEIIAAETATQFAIGTPTLEPSATRQDELPPAWTPTPEPIDPAEAAAAAALPPPPADIPGRIVAWGGSDLSNLGYLPITVYRVSDGSASLVGDITGRSADIRPDASRVIYTRYFPATFDFGLEEININGTQPLAVSERWRGYAGLLQAEQATYSLDGRYISFLALEQDSNAVQVFRLDVNAPPAPEDLPPTVEGATPMFNPITQLTSDGAEYSNPSISPDGSRVVVVRNDVNSPAPGEDLVIIDVATTAQTPLTSDLDRSVEAHPRWSPDGANVIYDAAPITDPNNTDIIVQGASSSAPRIPIVRDPSPEIMPIFSPDGRYIAFSSERNGQWDIYIFDTTTQTTYQLTNTRDDDFAGGWSAS